MAKADWENEDFEPKVFQKPLLNTDRWEGEDEDDDVKDNWDDDEEEKEDGEQTAVEVQPKKKRTLAQIIAEKEEKKRRELEEKMKLKEQAEEEDLTSEEILAEKLRQQKLQEESDLELAKEAFGVSDSLSSGIDGMCPTTKDDFDSFRRELINKISKYDSSPHFLPFLDDLCRDLCLTLQYEEIRKIASSLTALATEKLKAQKAASGKGKKKSKKADLNIGKKSSAIMAYNDFDEYEDCI